MMSHPMGGNRGKDVLRRQRTTPITVRVDGDAIVRTFASVCLTDDQVEALEAFIDLDTPRRDALDALLTRHVMRLALDVRGLRYNERAACLRAATALRTTLRHAERAIAQGQPYLPSAMTEHIAVAALALQAAIDAATMAADHIRIRRGPRPYLGVGSHDVRTLLVAQLRDFYVEDAEAAEGLNDPDGRPGAIKARNGFIRLAASYLGVTLDENEALPFPDDDPDRLPP